MNQFISHAIATLCALVVGVVAALGIVMATDSTRADLKDTELELKGAMDQVRHLRGELKKAQQKIKSDAGPKINHVSQLKSFPAAALRVTIGNQELSQGDEALDTWTTTLRARLKAAGLPVNTDVESDSGAVALLIIKASQRRGVWSGTTLVGVVPNKDLKAGKIRFLEVFFDSFGTRDQDDLAFEISDSIDRCALAFAKSWRSRHDQAGN